MFDYECDISLYISPDIPQTVFGNEDRRIQTEDKLKDIKWDFKILKTDKIKLLGKSTSIDQ